MPSDKQTTMQNYQTALDTLADHFENQTNNVDDPETESVDTDKTPAKSLKDTFISVLFARDDVFDAIRPDPEEKNYATSAQQSEITKLTESDAMLQKLGRKVLGREWIDLPFFRQVSAIDGERWWWNLDVIHFDDTYDRDINWRILLQIGLALILLVWLLPEAIRLITQVSQVLLRIFIRVDAEQLGLDIITFIAIGIQILISGRITVGLASPFTNSINRFFLRRTPSFMLRRQLLFFFPLSRILIASAMFALIILSTGFMLNELSEEIFSTVRNVEQPHSSRQSVLESTGLLQTDADFGIELTLIGINLEQIGNVNGSRLAYRQALETKPTLIYAAYRYADSFIEARNQPISVEDEQLAIHLLDSVTQYIESYRAGQLTLEELTLKDGRHVILLEFLTLTSRAELFLRTDQPRLARDTAEKALTIVERYQHLFDRDRARPIPGQPLSSRGEQDNPPSEEGRPAGNNPPDNRQNEDNRPRPEDESDSDDVKQRLARIYYVVAKANQTLQDTTGQEDTEYKQLALRYWRDYISYADERIIQEQIWLAEARQAIVPPAPPTPDLPVFGDSD